MGLLFFFFLPLNDFFFLCKQLSRPPVIYTQGQNENCVFEQNTCLYVSFTLSLLKRNYDLHACTCGCLYENASPQTGLLISLLLPCRALKRAFSLWCFLSNTRPFRSPRGETWLVQCHRKKSL